jgi:alpha-galactosidase
MEGQGETSDGDRGSLTAVVRSDTGEVYGGLTDGGGEWSIRDDVWMYYRRGGEEELKGGLTAGYGAEADNIGPGLQFGHLMGEFFDDQVLLIKTAWGGAALGVQEENSFHPPSSSGETGNRYEEMFSIINDVLGNLESHFPDYEDQGYEIAGFGWHQGWNDRIDQARNDEYEQNMKNFINDVRDELGVEKLPFVIATTGMNGWEEEHPRALSLMEAQLAMADSTKYPEFAGNVAVVETRGFYRPPEESPADQGYHWNRNAETYLLIGNGMGESMIELLSVPGCMDSLYEEYDPGANVHDSSACMALDAGEGNATESAAFAMFSSTSLDVTASGPHEFVVMGLDGSELLIRTGSGPKQYRYSDYIRPGLYVIRLRTLLGTAFSSGGFFY